MTQNNDGGGGLEDLRREIDGIDRQLLGLLDRRAEIVLQLGAIKKAAGGTCAGALRPGREAAIIRRLVETYDGPLPVAALVGLWRTIISAFLRLQYPFTVRVFSSGKTLFLRDLACAHFGAGTPMEEAADAQAILRSIAAGEAVLGVLPPPQDDPWWAGLPLWGLNRPRVVACLPVMVSDGGPRGYVLSAATPEASGDDDCWILVRGAADRETLLAAGRAAGLELVPVAAYKADGGAAPQAHLFSVPHPVPEQAAALAALARAASDQQVRGECGIIGLFARPVSSSSLRKTI